MKNIFKIFFIFLFLTSPAFANQNDTWLNNLSSQELIDNTGFKLLNANNLSGRMIFSYNKKRKKELVPNEIYKRQIIVSDEDLAHISSEDELAALIARKISLGLKSYDGIIGGLRGSLEAAFSPKKYEIIADKKAVEYLIKAGYNPLGLITYINKTCPQKRQDTISKHNLTSKRLMYIYEYIYRNAPYFLVYNEEYIKNEYYQNFLLNSIENRKKLEAAIKINSHKVQYE